MCTLVLMSVVLFACLVVCLFVFCLFLLSPVWYSRHILVLTMKIFMMYMTYCCIIRAVGEFSPDDEWWGNVNKYLNNFPGMKKLMKL